MGKKEDLILSAGRLWDEAKNMSALNAVAPQLPWPVYLAGDSRNVDGLETALTNCHYIGKLNSAELSEMYSRAAIYALPARYEPFGLSILEAALSGCALVIGDIPSLRETWDGVATFVPPDDVAALKEALLALISDAAYRTRMANSAYNRSREFTQSRMVDGYISLYQSAVAKFQEASGRVACVL
jgi:glycosyltransferase involved in cell wall biosynthesis